MAYRESMGHRARKQPNYDIFSRSRFFSNILKNSLIKKEDFEIDFDFSEIVFFGLLRMWNSSVEFRPIWSKSSFQSVSWFFFHNYPGRFWAGSRSLTNTQPLSLIYKYNICILWVFLEPYFSSYYLGISYHSSICKNVKLFSVELWPVIFEIKNEKNSSSFFFSVKILSKDSILDSHRSHDYITFLVVREIFTILRAQHSQESTSFHTFSEKISENETKNHWISLELRQISELEMTF